MATFVKRLCTLSFVGAMAMLIITLLPATANAQRGKGTPFCKKLFNPNLNPLGKIFASQGAQIYCFGRELNGFSIKGPAVPPSSKNVDAADPAEDISPNGTQAFGQSETSIAAVNQFVVEAWNDATGFFSPCPSPDSKEEFTGFGFSNNGGASFTDLGGLPNADCANSLYQGDPSVEAWEFQGQQYFYISSLFATATGGLEIAVTACQVTGPSLSCGQPTVVATSPTPAGGFSSLDKDFMAIDPMRGRLYISYTDFAAGDSIALAACDLTNNPMQPVCSNGSSNGPIYLVVAPPDPNGCENEGAYPAVDVRTGDVYVAYEHNWATNLTNFGPCASDRVKDIVAYVPHHCLTLPKASCAAPAARTAELVASLDAAFIPGYNRFPMNDFPRIAVSDRYGTVSIVWNDARFKPSGDVLLQSWFLGGALNPVQFEPVVVDSAATAGHGWQFLPGMRNTDDDGNLYISWYGRKKPDTAVTNVYEAVGVSPLTHATPANIKITDVASDWNAVSSDIIPNFGDYTDNYVGARGFGPPFTSEIDYTAWSDGRLGDPQPFEAHITH